MCLYVDSSLIIESNNFEIEDFKLQMKFELDMTYLGELGYFLCSKFAKN